jgi:hypothetical protein
VDPLYVTPSVLRERYPYRARVLTGNDYGLPIGKEFLLARRKDGDSSPFPIEVFSYLGDYRIYQFKEGEVELIGQPAENR